MPDPIERLQQLILALERRVAHLESAGIGAGGAGSGIDADLLDSQHGAYYRDAGNLNAGTVDLARIPTPLTGKDADTLDSRHAAGLLALTASGNSATDFVITAAAATFETDTSLTVTITPTVVSTLLVWIGLEWANDTANDTAAKFRAILDDITTAGDTDYCGAANIDNQMHTLVIARFTGVTVAAHTIKLQGAARLLAETVTIYDRRIMVVAIPE